MTPVEIAPIKAPFDLFTVFIEQHRQLKLRLDYNADLFTPDTIDRMTGHFHTLLESIVGKPERRINELNLLTEIERQRQLVGCIGTIPDDLCYTARVWSKYSRNRSN